MLKVAHLTSAHPRHDIRIFVKECVSLARAGFDVTLIVADGMGEEIRDGVRIRDVGAKTGGRFSRMTQTTKKVYEAALSLRPDVVHFHDPELLWVGLRLHQAGIKVIYDVHEDVPRQVLAKHWIPKWIRPSVSQGVESLEDWAVKKFDAVVTSTPHIQHRFEAFAHKVQAICNYPILEELVHKTPWTNRRNEVCYIGGISRIRGIEPIVEALPKCDTRLNLAGIWSESDLKAQLEQQAGWARVNDLGVLDRKGVSEVLDKSKVGLVTLFPTPNYVDALPIKLFEYMAAGIPVIASDFPVWRAIVEDAQCGLLVDPQDADAIADAIQYLLSHQEEAEKMGWQGQQTVLAKYSWAQEADKLVALYQSLTA